MATSIEDEATGQRVSVVAIDGAVVGAQVVTEDITGNVRRLQEAWTLIAVDQLNAALLRRHGERLSTADRRGNVGRGSSR